MNFFESEVIRIQQKIKEIEENPDLIKLKSDKLRYKVLLQLRKEQAEAWRQGKLFAGPNIATSCLFQSMGFTPSVAQGVTPTTAHAKRYLDKARDMGFPIENSCDDAYITAAIPFMHHWGR